MDCLQARKISLLGQAHHGDPEYLKATQHIAECSECELFFERENQLHKLVRAKLLKRSVSPGFRERLLTAVAKERQRKTDSGVKTIFNGLSRRRLLLGVAAALAAILLFVSSPVWQPSGDEQDSSVVNTLIQDHLASKLKEHPLDLVTADQALLERWFSSRVDFNVAVPRFESSTLIGGHLCLISGKRSVSVSFEKGNVPVTLYMIDRGMVDLTTLNAISSVNQKTVFHYDGKGCNMLLWEQRGLVYALVSDLSENELITLITQMS